MEENWLSDTLCSFEEKVRIELGPQLIELDCTEENLRDEVTFPHYRTGAVDALGKVIDPSKGGKMTCVDWRSKHVPPVWKMYQWQEDRFVKVDEFADKKKALSAARKLAGGM